MSFTFRTRKGNYYTINLTHFIFPLVVFVLAAVVVIIASVAKVRYQNTYEMTYKAILSRKASVTIGNSQTERNAVLRCAFSSPEIFIVDRVSYYNYDDKQVYMFDYNAYAADYENILKDYKERISRILSEAPDLKDDREAVKWIHDYIITHYEYGGDHSAYSMMTKGRGVCSAYTGLFTALADGLGLEHGVAHSDSMNHTWNIVKLDGTWYHIDVTWDDKGSTPVYDYYLKTSEEFYVESHYEWVDTGTSLTTYDNIKHNLILIGIMAFVFSVIISLIPLGIAYFTK